MSAILSLIPMEIIVGALGVLSTLVALFFGKRAGRSKGRAEENSRLVQKDADKADAIRRKVDEALDKPADGDDLDWLRNRSKPAARK